MEPSVLIVGAGTFGVSTAYHLAQVRRDPSRVTIIDREPSPPSKAAAIDINRIIRADYPSTLYCNLANEAIHAWFWSNELGPCFHKVGWLMLDEEGSDLSRRIHETLRGRGTHIMQDVKLGELSERWEVLAGTDTAGFASAYFNPDAGWADAASATRRFMDTAVRKGVRREVGDVVELLADSETGRVEGVRMGDGRRLTADRVVVAAGAWTSALLSPVEDALGVGEGDRVERQARATAIVSAYYRVSDEDVDRMDKTHNNNNNNNNNEGESQKMPCVVYGRTGEVIPACKGVGLLKYNNSGTRVVNTVTTRSGRNISVPTADRDQGDVPERLKLKTERVLTSRLVPRFARAKPEYWRMCWDACTPSEDLLLCEHPRVKSLYIITGGSFCGYKFMPNIGKYMVKVLDGESNGREKDRAWGWKSGAELERAAAAARGGPGMVTLEDLGTGQSPWGTTDGQARL